MSIITKTQAARLVMNGQAKLAGYVKANIQDNFFTYQVINRLDKQCVDHIRLSKPKYL